MGGWLRHWPWTAYRRRFLLFGLAGTQSAVATRYFLEMLPNQGEGALELSVAGLFAILFGWISLGFWTAAAGFWVGWFPARRYSVSGLLEQHADEAAPLPRTAIVMPICNEDVARVFAGLRATYRSLRDLGQLDAFEFFVLSDSSDPETWIAEEQAWAEWCRDMGDFERIHYRVRRARIKRKTGNIADFCRRWGAGFRYMVVLDADSVMAGETLVAMVRIMERRRQIGILQTAPRIVNRGSLYARIQQFANHVYGSLFAAGLSYWQMGDGYYWGHNAIIRLAPFMRHCALGRLSGRSAMGGEILSHDFVEAAYMRRAGWEVWLAHDLPGSYEEPPPTLLDELKRDRRWSQGNLQHLRLLSQWGLKLTHRIMFLYGIMAYGSSLLWLTLLALSTALVATARESQQPQYFPDHFVLFPSWPESWHPEWALGLLATTAVVLFGPKLLGLIMLARQGAVRLYGGWLNATVSMLLEALFSALLAPVRMLFHSRYVLLTLLGREVGWGTQQRSETGTRWRDALRHHGPGVFLALAWSGYVYSLQPEYLAWIAPIVTALLLAIPVSVWSSRSSVGHAARRLGWFLIPAETNPDPVLRLLHEESRRTAHLGAERGDTGFARVIADPAVNALHLSLLRPRARQPAETRALLAELRARALNDGPGSLSESERLRLLRDAESIRWLHEQVWSAGEERLAQWGVPATDGNPERSVSVGGTPGTARF